MSQSEYSRQLGITRQTLRRYIAKGLIILIDGKIDPEQADRDLALTASHRRKKLRFEADAYIEWPDD